MNENDLKLVYYDAYFSKEEADEIFVELEKQIEYFPSEITSLYINKRKMNVPRKVSAYGDKNLTYTFSGNTLPTKPLNPILIKLFKKSKKFGSFNYVLINRYTDGNDSIGFHQDNEKDMDYNSSIVTFSFGAERTIVFKRPNYDSFKIPLKHGSVLVMEPPTNKYWYHGIPKQKKVKNVRISLTFRKNVSSIK